MIGTNFPSQVHFPGFIFDVFLPTIKQDIALQTFGVVIVFFCCLLQQQISHRWKGTLVSDLIGILKNVHFADQWKSNY